MEVLNMTTGERMKARRKELGLSAEDVAEKLGKSPATIYRYEKGEIEKLPGDILTPLAEILHTTPAYLMGWEVRDTRTIPRGYEPLPTTVKRPLIGDIACGDPIIAEQNIRDYVDVPDDVPCDFCLRCHGDSMVDAHIQDGDLVYIRIQPDVEDGEIAAVRIGDEATLKRVFHDTDSITLIPANASYRPRTYTGQALEDIQIEGKMVGFTHWC
jgi:repressor LexA